MSHPSLQDYDLDTDYCDVENRDAPSDLARDSLVDVTETEEDESHVCETCQETESLQNPDTSQTIDAMQSGTYTDMSPDEDVSHLLYEGQASESQRDMNMILDDISPTSNDGRSITRTYWQQRDVPDAKKSQYGRMLEFQEGQWASERKGENESADNRRALQTFARVMGATDHQHDVAKAIVEATNLKYVGYSHHHSVLAALAIACFIADERDVSQDESYRQLVDDIGSNVKEMRNVKRLLREKSSYL